MAAPNSDEILRLLFLDEEGAQALEDDDAADEYLQPLINLGYLRLIDLQNGQMDPILLDKALHQFVDEAQFAGFSARLEPVGDIWLPDAATVTWMQDLVAVEGEIVMETVPEIGTQTLWTRILSYRLWVFGMLPDPASAASPWTAVGATALEVFGKLLAVQTLTALRLLGDLAKLIDEVLDNPKFFENKLHIAVYQHDANPPAKFWGNHSGAFLDGLKEDGIHGSEFNQLAAQIEHPDGAWLQTVFQSQHNTFMLRVVRVFQWVNGYYYGELGPTFGTNSFQSLLDLTELDTRAEFKHLTMRLNGTGFWVLNIVFLLRRMDRLADEPETTEATKPIKIMRGGKAKTRLGQQPPRQGSTARRSPPTLAELGDLLEAARPKLPTLKFRGKERIGPPDKDGKIPRGIAEGITRTMRSAREQQKVDLQQGTQVYRGSKSLRRMVARYAGKVWEWLKGFWNKLVGLAKNIASFIFRTLRKAYRCLADGLSLLLGNRQVSTDAAVYSDFDFDFDVVSAAAAAATPAQLANHGKTLIGKAQAMHTSLGVVGEAIALGFDLVTGNPIGWLKLGMKLAAFLKETASKRFLREEALTPA